MIDPCIPSSWNGFDITRKFRGVTYQIKVTNPNKVQKGVKKLIVDGKEVAGNIIPIMPKGNTCKVEVIMG
jgi:cellobiose phosphorylase